MTTKKLTILVVLAAVILTPMALAAPENGPGGGRGPRGEGRMGMRPQGGRGGGMAQMLLGRMGEELNLTEAQKESIKAIADESGPAVQEDRQAVRDAMQALNDAADNGDEAAIKAAGKAAGDALTQQALKRAAVSKKIKAVLTDEQNKKLQELRAQMQERAAQMRQNRGDGQGQGRGQGGGQGNGQRGPRRGGDDQAN